MFNKVLPPPSEGSLEVEWENLSVGEQSITMFRYGKLRVLSLVIRSIPTGTTSNIITLKSKDIPNTPQINASLASTNHPSYASVYAFVFDDNNGRTPCFGVHNYNSNSVTTAVGELIYFAR